MMTRIVRRKQCTDVHADHGEVIWLVVGDLRKVEAGIRDLKLGDVIRLDADGRPAGGTQ